MGPEKTVDEQFTQKKIHISMGDRETQNIPARNYTVGDQKIKGFKFTIFTKNVLKD